MLRRSRWFACGILSCLLWTSAAQAASRAGEIAALKPAATRNAQPAALRQEVDWNDVLATGPSGRLRAGLADGSQLSLGSSTQLTVTAHSPESQQTELQLLYGRLRSRVVPLTRPGSRFQVKTPTAAIGVIGTDFYVAATAQVTTVVCFRGTVTVQGTGRDQNAVTLRAGETVDISLDKVGIPQVAPAALLQESLALTSVGDLLDLPANTTLAATLAATLDARKAKPGDAVAASVEENLKLDGAVTLPKKSRILGHVTEAQARSKETRESRLAVEWDQALLPGGEQVALNLVMQAVAAPPTVTEPAPESADFPASAAARAPGAPMGPPMGGEPVGNVASTAASTLGAADNVARNGAGTPAGETVAGVARAAAPLPGLDASGRLTAASQGAINLPGLALTSESAGGAVISSSNRNVRLESGTQILLRTGSPSPHAR